MCKTILKWPGGKRRLLPKLLPHIPSGGCFVDVFGGAGSVLFAREPSGVEVYNDIDSRLVSLFRVVKHHHAALVQEFEFSLNSRADFMARRDMPGLTDIQQAATFLYLNALSFGGDSDSFGVQRKKGGGQPRIWAACWTASMPSKIDWPRPSLKTRTGTTASKSMTRPKLSSF